MSNMEELSLDALEQVVGGVLKQVQTGTDQNAAIRDNPGGDNILASLPNGTYVNTISAPKYDQATGRNWVHVEYKDGRGRTKKGWIAASIIGMKR